MQIKMTIDECMEFADEWARGCTFHEGSQGWRVVCMLLAEEVRRMRAAIAGAPVAVMDTRDVLGICAPEESDFPALYALQGKRVRLVLESAPMGRLFGCCADDEDKTANEQRSGESEGGTP